MAGIVCAGAVAGLVATAWPAPSEPAGKPHITVDLYVLPQVMTAVYKVYGGSFSDIYLARCTIKNTGTAPVTNFQITYKIPGYVEETSSQDYPIILPGQTVRDYCWPTFEPKQMRLIQSNTRAELQVTYTWDGLDRPRRESEKFTLLGHNSFVYTYLTYEDRMGFGDMIDNARYLAAFVTYQDPKVQRLAKRLTGNVGASLSDDDAWLAAQRIFYGLQALPMRYITEHFDPSQGVQYVQFPRDTIMNRAGTCIDTAILFSALLEAVGIKTYLILLAGHCIPAMEMPDSEDIYYVESTFLRLPNARLTDACNSAYHTYHENKKNDTYMWVDVEEAWADGFVPSW